MRFLFAALASLAFASSALAQDGGWTVVQTIGEVTVEQPGLSKMAVKPNARLNDGTTITTGAGGRAVLTDGRSSITVASSSRIELPAANDENMTSIRQDFGTAVFKVQKKPTAHFEVQTPFLAAVVKGTTFEVKVDALGASVDVEEGLVDVGSALSGERTLVPGGQRVRVLRSGRFDGGRPAGLGNDQQTVAALNLINVEIAPEDPKGPAQEREFAALDPRADGAHTPGERRFDRDHNDGGSKAELGGIESNGAGADAGAQEPVQPAIGPSISDNQDDGQSSDSPTRDQDRHQDSPDRSSGNENHDREEDRDHSRDTTREFDRSKWEAALSRLREAYNDWRSRRRD